MATVFTDSGDSKAASTIASETPKPPDEDGKSGDKSAGTDVKSEVDTTPQPSTQAESVAQDDKQTKTAEIPGSDSAAPSAAKVSDGGESVPDKSASNSVQTANDATPSEPEDVAWVKWRNDLSSKLDDFCKQLKDRAGNETPDPTERKTWLSETRDTFTKELETLIAARLEQSTAQPESTTISK